MGQSILYALIDALQYGLPYAMLALGVFITYRQLDIADLGCEGTFTLGGAVVGVLIIKSMNPFLAMLIGIAAGFLAGVITGLLHTKLKIPALLSGIITLTGLFSINMVIMGGGNRTVDDKGFFAKLFQNYNANIYLNGKNIAGDKISTIYTSFQDLLNSIFGTTVNYTMCVIIMNVILVGLAIALLYLFFGTEVGMSIRSTGMNPLMSRAQGINTSLMIIIGLGISNALIALGGAMFTQVNKSASNTMGVGTIVVGLASIIIGEAIFGKRTFKNWLFSVTFGAIIYYLIIAIALALHLPNHYLKLLYAILIIIILVVPHIKKLFKTSDKKRGKAQC